MSTPARRPAVRRAPLDRGAQRPEQPPGIPQAEAEALASATVAELLTAPDTNGGEAGLIDGIETLLAGARAGRAAGWALRLDGRREDLACAREVAAGAGIEVERGGGGLLAAPAMPAALRPLLERAGGARSAALCPVDATTAVAVREALVAGDLAAALRAAGMLVIVHPGRSDAMLLHDPTRSGLDEAQGPPVRHPADRTAAPTPGRLGRRAAVAAAVLVAAGLVVVGVRAEQGSAGRSAPEAAGATPGAAPRPVVQPGQTTPPRPGPAPSLRQQPASAVDPVSGLTIMFGGILAGPGSPHDAHDTWLWSTGRWTDVTASAASPPARHGGLLAPDPGPAGGFILVGGTGSSGALHDAWRWDGGTWAQEDGAAVPAGTPVAMTADVRRHTVVLITRIADGTLDTEILQSGVWISLHTPTPPIALVAGDAAVGVVGLSLTRAAPAGPATTYMWTGAAWLPVTPAHEPEVDSLTATLTGVGGGILLSQVDFTDASSTIGGTWSFDGRDWAHAGGPSPDFLRAFDSTTAVWGVEAGAAVLIGGSAGDDAYRRVERFDGERWSSL